MFADDFGEMYEKAIGIASWDKNVNTKVPVSNTKNEFSGELINKLSAQYKFAYVTTLIALDQVNKTIDGLV